MKSFLLATIVLLALGGSADAQNRSNPQCPTRPQGDSTNACASTAFVQGAVGTTAGITVGTTTVTGGTSGNILRNNAGVLGEYTSSGSGTALCLTISCVLTNPTATGLTVTGSFNATGLVTNADLVNPSTTVNGVDCTLGSTCAITATAASMTVGTTSIIGGTSGNVLRNVGGVLGEYTVSGSGTVLCLTTSCVMTTPTLGNGTFTSLAGSVLAPQSDSTAALTVTKADKTTSVMTFDTSNRNVGVRGTPGGSYVLEVFGGFSAHNHIDSTVGFTLSGAAGSGTFLRGNGTNYVASGILAGDLPLASDASGSPSATAGAIKCDGTTVVCSSGVMSSTGGSLAAKNVYTGDNLFGSGRPWCDVQAKGAVGDGVTNDHAAIQACVDELNILTTGVVYFPPPHGGAYCNFSTVTTNSNVSIIFMGTGVNGSVLSACGHNITLLALQGGNSGLQHMQLLGYGAASTDTLPVSNPTLDLSHCVQCLIDDAIVLGGYYGIKCGVGCGDIIISNTLVSYAYGAGVYIGCTSGLCGGYLKRVKIDQDMPNPGSSFGATTAFSNWSAGATVSAGDILFVSGAYYIRYTVGGTTGGSAPTVKPWLVNITDGTATAQLFSPFPYYGVQCDGGCNQTFAEQLDVLSNSYTYGLAMTNDNASVDPTLFAVSNSNFQGYLGAALLDKGNEFRSSMNLFEGCWITNCAIVNVGTSWGSSGSGGIKSVNDYLVNGSYGWDIQPTGNINGVFTNGSYQGLNQTAFITPGSSFNFSNNICGPAGTLAGPINQCYSIVGAADYFIVTNNQTNGATLANSITATGTHTTTTGNLH